MSHIKDCTLSDKYLCSADWVRGTSDSERENVSENVAAPIGTELQEINNKFVQNNKEYRDLTRNGSLASTAFRPGVGF